MRAKRDGEAADFETTGPWGAALLVFEVLRSRRPLQLAARSATPVAVSPALFVASGIHGDPLGWPWPSAPAGW